MADINLINSAIITAFQATQLILVFVTVVFLLRYPQIQEDIHSKTPPGDGEKKSLKKELSQSIWEKCIPLLLINGVAFCLFIPLTWHVIESIINIDFVRASFLFIVAMIFIILIWSFKLTYELYKRMNKL